MRFLDKNKILYCIVLTQAALVTAKNNFNFPTYDLQKLRNGIGTEYRQHSLFYPLYDSSI